MELDRMGRRDTFTRICLVSIGSNGERGEGGGGDLSGRDGEVEKDYSSRILLVMILRGNERGDTVTGYPVTLHYPRQPDGTLVLEKVCRVHRLLRPHDSLHE